MRDAMLPSAPATLYEIEARSLTASYRDGVSTATLLAVVLAGCALLALLVATQVYLARATRRGRQPAARARDGAARRPRRPGSSSRSRVAAAPTSSRRSAAARIPSSC